MSEKTTIDKIRKILQDSDLTMTDSDCSVVHEWRNDEIESMVHQIVCVLDEDVIYLED